ncbi:hypothetical protein ABZ570_24900 [Micromonospora sp. NPDC007271]
MEQGAVGRPARAANQSSCAASAADQRGSPSVDAAYRTASYP